MSNFTFLTEEQIFDDNKLEIFNKRGTRAPITDFAILLGGYYSSDFYYKNEESLENRAGYYWTKTDDKDNDARVVNESGNRHGSNVNGRDVACRPTLPYSSIKDICSPVMRASDCVLEVECGEYPQNVASKELQKKLFDAYSEGRLISTGKTYTTDSKKNNDYEKGFEPINLTEYEYEGKKYVRVMANTSIGGDKILLSNNEKYKDGDFVWVEVSPVKWLVDEKNDIAVSERLLFAGVQFKKERNYKGNFESTDIKKYLDNYFSKDIIPSKNIIKTKDIKSTKANTLQNAYEFNFEKVTEEDLIRGSLESNIAPFLHGRSSEGKSARIKEFDPEAEIVYLRNATPDSLNGKSVYDSKNNQMIDVPPTWYVKLKEKCDAEPDKLHIVFFDELTNALPSIQGMAFNIILDKEINGKWKLPENARVAAAGNDLEDSLAANTMAEPLFNRFNHVYINTTVDSWLNWALTPTDSYERLDYKKDDNSKQLKIHPAIYAYIACKKDAVLRTKFTGVKPNADPRKWEMASKVLYQTNNPYMLRGLIGEDLTNDFAAFCKTKVITLQDVINGNYDEKIFEINSSEKYLTVLALSSANEENLEVVRSFIEKLGEEFLALFDSLWTIGDDERLETLMNLKQGKVKIKK